MLGIMFADIAMSSHCSVEVSRSHKKPRRRKIVAIETAGDLEEWPANRYLLSIFIGRKLRFVVSIWSLSPATEKITMGEQQGAFSAVPKWNCRILSLDIRVGTIYKGEIDMTILGKILCWVFSIFILFVSLMMLGMGGVFQSAMMLGIALTLLPPFASLVQAKGLPFTWFLRGLVIVVLLAGIVLSLALNPATSIYKSPEVREELVRLYDEKLEQWPTPYESRFVDTKYGKVHVIVSGPGDGYPVLLFNASALAGWSWMFNVGALNQRYRTYAIDNIGEAGKNELKEPGSIPKTGQEIAAYYTDISNKLGVKRSHVIGASIGGFIATNYAMHAKERVNRLVLLGSMGYGFTAKTVLLMILAQGFPIGPVQDATLQWAFGESPRVIEPFSKWFRLVMKGMVPTPIAPRSLTVDELSAIETPTLSFIGTKDAVVGDSQTAAELAGKIPGSRVRIVDTGHLMGVEIAEQVNAEIMEFFAADNL